MKHDNVPVRSLFLANVEQFNYKSTHNSVISAGVLCAGVCVNMHMVYKDKLRKAFHGE